MLTSTHPPGGEKDAATLISELFSQINDKCGVKREEKHEPLPEVAINGRGGRMRMTCDLTQARIEARLTHELLVALSGAVRGDGEIMGSQDHRIIQARRNHRRALVQPLTHSMTNY